MRMVFKQYMRLWIVAIAAIAFLGVPVLAASGQNGTRIFRYQGADFLTVYWKQLPPRGADGAEQVSVRMQLGDKLYDPIVVTMKSTDSAVQVPFKLINQHDFATGELTASRDKQTLLISVSIQVEYGTLSVSDSTLLTTWSFAGSKK